MTTIDPASPAAILPALPPAAPPPLLEHGDRLTWQEFERRYTAMPWVKKAELIEGKVHLPSPLVRNDHASAHASAVFWLGYYEAFTPITAASHSGSLRLDVDDVVQADGLLRILPEFGGRCRVVDGYLEGSPELITEVAASSVSYDLHDKLNVYRRNQVLEYIVWRVLDRQIDWFVWRAGRYERATLSPDGLYKSEVFPGLWLRPAALIADDYPQVIADLQAGLATPEHAAFVARLQAGRQQLG